MTAHAMKSEKLDLGIERVMRSAFWSPRRELAKPAEVVDLAGWKARRASV